MGKCINAEHHKRLERETKCKENEAEHEKKNKKKCKRTFSENHSPFSEHTHNCEETEGHRDRPFPGSARNID